MACARSLAVLLACSALAQSLAAQGMALVNRPGRGVRVSELDRPVPAFRFENRASEAGLLFRHVAGDPVDKTYILEVTGSGVAIFDYDNDGLADVFFVNQTRWHSGDGRVPPTNRLFRNAGDLRFEDVTAEANLVRTGWGQGACVADYDNDGDEDLFVTYWGDNVLYRNEGDGRFEDVTGAAFPPTVRRRWSTGCAFLDYDRDGSLDLAVANYIRFDLGTTPKPGENELCRFQGNPVVCGPRGLPSETATLYRNTGHGTYADVSHKSGLGTGAMYGFAVLTGDYNRDGWTDIYVACDSSPSRLFENNRDGSFTEVGYESGTALNEHGQEQGGMGAAAGDYNRDGWIDIVKTNFANDIPSLYRNEQQGLFSEVSIRSGLGTHTSFVGWGVAFVDVDHDTWQDVIIVNGHVYRMPVPAGRGVRFEQSKHLYWNLADGTFAEISGRSGSGLVEKSSARGAAFGDLDNDGRIEVVVNNLDSSPSLLVNAVEQRNWIRVDLEGTRSNRNGIGARVSVRTGDTVQVAEARSGGSFLSHSDLRLHFGLGNADQVDEILVRWTTGAVEAFPSASANRTVVLREGRGTPVQTPDSG